MVDGQQRVPQQLMVSIHLYFKLSSPARSYEFYACTLWGTLCWPKGLPP